MRRRLILVSAVVAAACGRIGFDDLASDDADEFAPFGTPVLVTELMSPNNDDDPTLTGDLLEIYFASSRPGTNKEDIFRSVRAAIGDPWNPPMPVIELNTGAEDGSPEITPDGLTIFLGSRRSGGSGDFDVYVATRTARGQPWTAPVRIPELSSSGTDFSATPAADLLSLTMHSDRAGDEEVYVSSRASLGSMWSTPALVAELSSAASDRNAFARSNNTVIYFASSRPGGEGRLDIWRATRPEPDSPFSSPLPVTELNGVEDDEDPWFSPDGRTVFYSREVGGQKDLFTATR